MLTTIKNGLRFSIVVGGLASLVAGLTPALAAAPHTGMTSITLLGDSWRSLLFVQVRSPLGSSNVARLAAFQLRAPPTSIILYLLAVRERRPP